MKISSPAASWGGDLMHPIVWLDQFFALCPTCKVDFIATHVSFFLKINIIIY